MSQFGRLAMVAFAHCALGEREKQILSQEVEPALRSEEHVGDVCATELLKLTTTKEFKQLYHGRLKDFVKSASNPSGYRETPLYLFQAAGRDAATHYAGSNFKSFLYHPSDAQTALAPRVFEFNWVEGYKARLLKWGAKSSEITQVLQQHCNVSIKKKNNRAGMDQFKKFRDIVGLLRNAGIEGSIDDNDVLMVLNPEHTLEVSREWRGKPACCIDASSSSRGMGVTGFGEQGAFPLYYYDFQNCPFSGVPGQCQSTMCSQMNLPDDCRLYSTDNKRCKNNDMPSSPSLTATVRKERIEEDMRACAKNESEVSQGKPRWQWLEYEPLAKEGNMWTAPFVVLPSVETSPYYEGVYFIDLAFPPTYPSSPPRMSFRTRIEHPFAFKLNIPEVGTCFCLDVLGDGWEKNLCEIFPKIVKALSTSEEEWGTLSHDNCFQQSVTVKRAAQIKNMFAT